MPFIVMLKASGRFYMMGDSQGNVIGFQTQTQALEHFEGGVGTTARLETLPEIHCDEIAPSIVEMPTFREVVECILPERVKGYLMVNGAVMTVGLGTRSGAGYYWEKGRRKALDWLRKGDRALKSKLRGKETIVSQMLKDGLSDVAIASRLGVHYQTVTHYVYQMQLERGNRKRMRPAKRRR